MTDPTNSVDYGPLINLQAEPSPRMAKVIDVLSLLLPVVAAGLSIGAGIAALEKADAWAAGLGIAGGVVSALGVIFTGWASRIRDGRLTVARSTGQLGVDLANHALAQHPYHS